MTKQTQRPDPSFFQIEQQWQFHLAHAGLDEAKIVPFKRIEMKRAFMGAAGQVIALMTDELTLLPPPTALSTLTKMLEDGLRYLAGPVPEESVTSQDTFNVHQQWRKYLELMNVKEQAMSEEQRRTLKHVFVAAWVQLLLVMKDHVSSLSEVEGVAIVQNIFTELREYWAAETIRHYANESK
jgi:hypothetical protein